MHEVKTVLNVKKNLTLADATAKPKFGMQIEMKTFIRGQKQVLKMFCQISSHRNRIFIQTAKLY